MVHKVIRVGGAATLLVGAALLVTPSPALAAGTCSPEIIDGGHTAVATCSRYPNSTGTFRVVATACYTTCQTITGPWAYLNGGTSKVNSYMYLTDPRVEMGPAVGVAAA